MFGRKSNAQATIVSDKYPLLGRRAVFKISERELGRIERLTGMNNASYLVGDVFPMDDNEGFETTRTMRAW